MGGLQWAKDLPALPRPLVDSFTDQTRAQERDQLGGGEICVSVWRRSAYGDASITVIDYWLPIWYLCKQISSQLVHKYMNSFPPVYGGCNCVG